MEHKLQSLPKFIREEPGLSSPKFQDLAFPPFKIEHRYRGVYERAGFDVNLSAYRNNDNRSVRLGKRSPTLPLSTNKGFTQQPRSGSQPHVAGSPYLQKGAPTSLPAVFTHANASQHSQPLLLNSGRENTPYSPLTKTGRKNPYTSEAKAYNPYERQTSYSGGADNEERAYGRQNSNSSGRRNPYEHQKDHTSYDAQNGNAYERQNGRNPYEPQNGANPFDTHNGGVNAYQRQNSLSSRDTHSVASNGYSGQGANSYERQNSISSSRERQASVSNSYEGQTAVPGPYQGQNSASSNPYVPNYVSSNPYRKNSAGSGFSHGSKHTNGSGSQAPYPTENAFPQEELYPSSLSSDSQQIFNQAPGQNSPPSSPEATEPRLPRDDSFDFSPKPSFSAKNYKNLHLDLNNDNLLDHSSENDASDLPKFDSFDTTQTTVDKSASNIHPEGKRLLTMLSGLKNDVEEQRMGKNSDFAPAIPYTSPSEIGLKRFASPEVAQEQRFSYSNGAGDPLAQFSSFSMKQRQDDSMLNLDYQRFLTGEAGANVRHSNMSMVSSIISKGSRYLDDEDDEIEKELQKQLESLKVAGSKENIDHEVLRILKYNQLRKFSEDHAAPSVNNDSFVTAHDTTFGSMQVPTFSIEHVDVEPKEAETKPLAVRAVGFSETVTTHQLESPGTSPESDTFDEVKPLSPKNHHVEQELHNLNFGGLQGPQNEVYGEDEDLNAPTESSIDSILAKAAPAGFQPFPQLVSALPNMGFDRSFKHPAGVGPCRCCRQEISANARGVQRAIYSKTGELSGQWHRLCFGCTYENCTITFDKSVQCYALHDQPFCHSHYHELNGTLCENCHSGIEGECIENELQQKWHLSCLKCYKCSRAISSDYYLINGHVFCDHDAANIINGCDSYNDMDGNLRTGLSTHDKIEKRRTRLLYVD